MLFLSDHFACRETPVFRQTDQIEKIVLHIFQILGDHDIRSIQMKLPGAILSELSDHFTFILSTIRGFGFRGRWIALYFPRIDIIVHLEGSLNSTKTFDQIDDQIEFEIFYLRNLSKRGRFTMDENDQIEIRVFFVSF